MGKAMKTCAHCKKVKPIDQFTTNKQQKNGLCPYCKPCIKILRKTKWRPSPEAIRKRKEDAKKWSQTDKGKRAGRNASYKMRYGITLEIYEEMFDSQKGRCAMCREVSEKRLVVDHDHLTEKVRGLLCPRCNVFLGYIESYDGIIKKAYAYLGE